MFLSLTPSLHLSLKINKWNLKKRKSEECSVAESLCCPALASVGHSAADPAALAPQFASDFSADPPACAGNPKDTYALKSVTS